MPTNREICEDALRKIGVLAKDEPADADDIETARRSLERLLASWQNREILRFKTSTESVTLTTAASYALSKRAVSIWTARLKRTGLETPMNQMSRDEYDSLPNKSSTGLPTQFYYDRQSTTGTVFVWPILAAAAGETIEVTYVAPMDAIDLSASTEVPVEWEEAVVYNLAARLADDYEIGADRVIARAEAELEMALADDRPYSVRFVDAHY